MIPVIIYCIVATSIGTYILVLIYKDWKEFKTKEMNWIQKIKAWNKLIRSIDKNRKIGRSSFRMLTTGDELIVYPDHAKFDNIIRIKYK